MRSTLAALVILALAACGDDGPSVLDLDEVRIVKVAGDQAAVAGTSQATPLHSVSASPRYTVTAGEDWTPEPLVGRIETVGARTNGISGPSMLPPDMLAHWHLDPEAGALLAASTPPDDSAYIMNRWAPSTKAGEYTAVARRILADGSIITDATWTLVVEPGVVAAISGIDPRPTVQAGDSLWIPSAVGSARDAHHNAIDPASLASHPAPQWAWAPAVAGGSAPSEPTGAGWATVVPVEAAEWAPMYGHSGPNAVLYTWFGGEQRGGVSVIVQ